MVFAAGRLASVVTIAALNTLVVGLCADKVWDSLRVLGCVGRLAVAAGAVECESFLIMRVSSYPFLLSGEEMR